MRRQPDSRTGPIATPVSPGEEKLNQLESRESSLWRLVLLVMVLLAAAFAVNSWESIRNLPDRAFRDLAALPLSVLVVMVLFALYVWKKKREMAELRGFVRGLAQRDAAPPSEQQLEKLFEVVAVSQQGYRDLIDSFDDAVFTVSLEGQVRAANRSFADLLGQTFPGFVGRQLDEFIEEPAIEDARKLLPRLLERRQWSGRVRVKLRATGAIRYFDCNLQAVVKEGEVTGVSCLAHDVTERRDAEARFTELFETLQEGIYFTTPDGQILDANPALVRMLGYESKEDLQKTTVGDLFADPAMRASQLSELAQRGHLRESEIQLRRKDGRVISCLDTTTVIRNSSGQVVRYQGSLVDITERRTIERKLHEEQEFAQRLVNSFPDLIVVVDCDHRYRFVSPSIEELLGYRAEDLVGKIVGERSHPDDKLSMDELCREILSGRKNFIAMEYRTQHRNGSWRVFRAAAAPLMDTQGNITGLVASSRDFTELKHLEQQVIQSEKMAAVGQLIAGVAHELNNPLTAILGISDLLREQAASEGGRRQLDLVHEQARRAADIVGNLLAFSRPAKAQKLALSLNEIVQRTLQLHEYSLRVNNILVDFAPDAGLSPVFGDSNQLMQVFLNLIVNAEQAIRGTKQSGVLRVRTGVREQMAGRIVWATVEDDGPGIPEDALQRIFDPFFTTKRPGRGTGLGLSICMALVKEHGGTIEAQNGPQGGAIFTIGLPAQVPSAAAAAGAAGMESASASQASLAGRTILVVDDEPSIRELIQAGLSSRGIHVECAANGDEALRMAGAAAAAQRPYDAVLCDMKMPGLSGDQVFERLSQQPGATSGAFRERFIFMTGDLMDQGTVNKLRESGVRCVQKPFRVGELVTALRETLHA